ncbi:MAG: OmpA family protein [Bacteroidales bacterium]|nr:OmpA family protein [Bacteroidales bacterium]
MKTILLTFLSVLSIQFAIAQGSKPVLLVSGKALNERNMQPVDVDVRVVYEELPSGKQAGIARINPMDGSYKIILPYGKRYSYMAIAEGYYSVTNNLDVSDLNEYQEVDEQNLFLAPLMVDQVVRINNLFFKDKTAELLPESYFELDRFVEFLKLNKKIKIELGGHTDNVGGLQENMDLSLKRAEVVAEYLKKNKIKADRIEVKAYGPTRPIGFNNNEEGRAMNNRIEFKVLSLDYKS